MTFRMSRVWVSFLSLVLFGTSSLRADNIDLRLYADSYKVIEQMQKHGFKNVGVLHFRCQKEERRESFTLGTINSSMADRLKNALILHMPMDEPIGIARDASATAGSHKVGSWQKQIAERKKLFTFSYPPSWGSSAIKPDAFLTGMIRLNKTTAKSGELETTTVVIEAFTAQAPDKLLKLYDFTVATDRQVLREFGQSYTLDPRSLTGKRGFDRDQMAVRSARRRDVEGTSETSVTPDDMFGLSIKILYDEVPQEIRPDPNSQGEWRVSPPNPGAKVAFAIKNTGSKAPILGAVLHLNGRSLWQQKTGDITQEEIWLFRDSSEAATEFKGFYTDVAGTNVVPFKVLSAEESEAREAEFGDRVGVIDIDVYESRPTDAEDEMKISLARGLKVPGKNSRSLETLRDAKAAVILSDRKLFSRERADALKRNLIVASDEPPVTGGDVQIQSMPKPLSVGHFTIRYYDPKKSGDSLQISN